MRFRLTEDSVQGPVKCSGECDGHNVDDDDYDDRGGVNSTVSLYDVISRC